MKFFKLLAVLAVVVLLAGTAYAETQSVKVSGDLTVRGIWRSNYDLRGSVPEVQSGGIVAGTNAVRTGLAADGGGMTGVAYAGPQQSFFMSTTEVQVDAELTDCVSTCIRLLNERDWNVRGSVISQAVAPTPNGQGGYGAKASDFDVQVDLAYVTLKDFIYSPLTVTIGRQDLWFGKGFVVGSNHVFNNAWNWSFDNNGVLQQRLAAPEYTAMHAFDSVKAVLDYDPWTITGIYAKIMENTVNMDDDTDLWGLNVGYQFDCYKAEAEAYWFAKIDHSFQQWNSKATNDVQTIGIRGSMDPLDCVTIAAEGAWQFGQYAGNRNGQGNMDRQAWAMDLSGEYRLPECFCWNPKLGLEYIIYSGDQQIDNTAQRRGVYTGWDPMFRGKFDSAIREFVGTYYATYDYGVRPDYYVSCPDASFTNQQQLIFSASAMPMDSVTLKANYNMFWLMEEIQQNNQDYNGGYIGSELDLQATWDYTEDVSFGMLCGFFYPGQIYKNADKTATDVVGTVKVSF